MEAVEYYILQNKKTKAYMTVSKDGDEFGFFFTANEADAWQVPDMDLARHYQDALRILTKDGIAIVTRRK